MGYVFKSQPPELRKPCSMCKDPFSIYPRHSIGLAVEDGVKYPDILGCGEYPSLLIVSKNVIDDWENAGITGYEKYEANIVEAKGKRIRDLEPPQYYHINITGRTEYDMDAMGFKYEIQCEYCGRRKIITRNFSNTNEVPNPTIIRANSWDGSDIFAMDLTPMRPFCTEKLLYLAGRNERTNFRFVPLELTGDASFKGLDYKAIAKRMLREKRNPFEK